MNNMDTEIIQLRNYNLNRAKDNSAKPVYPITLGECVKVKSGNDLISLDEALTNLPSGGDSSGNSNNIAPKTFLFNEVFAFDGVQPKVGDDISEPMTDAAYDTLMNEAETGEKVNIYDASTGVMYVVVYGDNECIVNSIVDSNKSIDWIYDDYTGIYWTKRGDKAIMLGQASIESYRIVTGHIGSGNASTSFAATVQLNPCKYTKFKTRQEVSPEDIISVGEAAITSIKFTLPDSIINSIFYPLMVFSGRFIAYIDDITITFPNNIVWADSNPSIEANHHYEWSIKDNVFSIFDVTETSEDTEGGTGGGR